MAGLTWATGARTLETGTKISLLPQPISLSYAMGVKCSLSLAAFPRDRAPHGILFVPAA